jgi:2,4-dienoyl-CoA reductase-like NADH-dependent reductase (Old Yellow Enzyme family)/thioredoxin reductase
MKLFDPIQLKDLPLKNRIVMASMGTNLADPEGFVTDEMIAYYTERAKGGAGLIMTELTTVDFPLGNGIERQLSIDDDKYLPGLRRLTDQIHRHGSKIFVQLNHAGNRAKPESMGRLVPVSASNVPSGIIKVEPRPLTLEEISNLIDAFGQAARRAKEAGFDGIDLHFAHGYLLCQFLSSFTNKRMDEYGGNLENRARLALEVLERCRHEVGGDFPISAKVVGHQYVSGGISLRETKVFCHLLQQKGIDAIQVSGGDPESPDHFPVPPMYSKRGCYVNLAQSIKKAVNIPVIAVGRINNVLLANQIIESGKADLVAMGRAFLADPDFPRKAQEGKLEEIRMCIGCNQGCRGRDRTKYLTVGCILNPRVGKEKEESEIVPAGIPRHVLVLGGGPAGMEAARVAALRGHKVTLVEEQRGLGGQLRVAARAPGRGEFRHLIEWYRIQMIKLGVKLLLGRKATVDLVRSVTPDLVILATGSRPLSPEIEGLKQIRVAHASEILEKKIQIGHQAVIIGGGGVGLETADFLASRGKRVTVIEQLSEVGRDLEGSTKKVLMARLARNGVEILTGTIIDKVEIGKISVQWNGGKKEIAFDEPLINATGAEANLELYPSLKKIEELKNLNVHVIGDSISPRQLREAISEGYATSQTI